MQNIAQNAPAYPTRAYSAPVYPAPVYPAPAHTAQTSRRIQGDLERDHTLYEPVPGRERKEQAQQQMQQRKVEWNVYRANRMQTKGGGFYF